MGLEWSDIDFTNGIVSINKSSQYLSNKGVFTKTPKTESSIRDVAIPNFVVSLLEEYRIWYEQQNPSTTNYGLILIGYLYSQMVSLCIHQLLVNGLLIS